MVTLPTIAHKQGFSLTASKLMQIFVSLFLDYDETSRENWGEIDFNPDGV